MKRTAQQGEYLTLHTGYSLMESQETHMAPHHVSS
jgi:hypothetical protein